MAIERVREKPFETLRGGGAEEACAGGVARIGVHPNKLRAVQKKSEMRNQKGGGYFFFGYGNQGTPGPGFLLYF
jgi:hypothetical protein